MRALRRSLVIIAIVVIILTPIKMVSDAAFGYIVAFIFLGSIGRIAMGARTFFK